MTKKKIVNSYNKLNRENIILSVGRLCKQKNFENLILAFKKFNKKNSKYKLNIIGDGYNKEKFTEDLHDYRSLIFYDKKLIAYDICIIINC